MHVYHGGVSVPLEPADFRTSGAVELENPRIPRQALHNFGGPTLSLTLAAHDEGCPGRRHALSTEIPSGSWTQSKGNPDLHEMGHFDTVCVSLSLSRSRSLAPAKGTKQLCDKRAQLTCPNHISRHAGFSPCNYAHQRKPSLTPYKDCKL